MRLILASASPRRRELMGAFGHPFEVCSADIDETMDPKKSPFEEVARVSRLKALAIPREQGDVVVAADTIVVCGGKVLVGINAISLLTSAILGIPGVCLLYALLYL